MVGGGGGREILCLSLHCQHQNYFCIKMGSDESHFNVSLIVRDKVTRWCPTLFEEKAEPKLYQTVVFLLNNNALPLGQSGSHQQLEPEAKDSPTVYENPAPPPSSGGFCERKANTLDTNPLLVADVRLVPALVFIHP